MQDRARQLCFELKSRTHSQKAAKHLWTLTVLTVHLTPRPLCPDAPGILRHQPHAWGSGALGLGSSGLCAGFQGFQLWALGVQIQVIGFTVQVQALQAQAILMTAAVSFQNPQVSDAEMNAMTCNLRLVGTVVTILGHKIFASSQGKKQLLVT